MTTEEAELLNNFRHLTPENKQLTLANIRLAAVVEKAVKRTLPEKFKAPALNSTEDKDSNGFLPIELG
jgi:hypothetical protein